MNLNYFLRSDDEHKHYDMTYLIYAVLSTHNHNELKFIML